MRARPALAIALVVGAVVGAAVLGAPAPRPTEAGPEGVRASSASVVDRRALEPPRPPPDEEDITRAAAKATAVSFVEASGSWTQPAPSPLALVRRAGYGDRLAGEVAALADRTATRATTQGRGQITGLTATTAAVAVVARQSLTRRGGDVVREVGLDVRLVRAGPGRPWTISDRIEPRRPPLPPSRGGRGALEAQVLSHPGIALSGPARDDVAAGRVGAPLLVLLLDLARGRSLGVHVFSTGHPRTVFPEQRLSNHAVGRGVDIVALDGRPVEALAPAVVDATMSAAARAGATEVGGPVTPRGRGFFTDAVHQDHVHVGITPGKRPADAP